MVFAGNTKNGLKKWAAARSNLRRSAHLMKWSLTSLTVAYDRATLQLRLHPRYGKDVTIAIEKGQFLCGFRNCQVSVRFDSGKAQNFSAVEPADHSTTMLFIRGYDRFLASARKAKKVYIEALFYQQGTRVFEFDISGLNW